MKISLTSEQDDAVNRLIEAGLFATRDEAIARSHEWLREEAEKLDAIRRKVETALRQSAHGESRPLDADEIWRRVRERLDRERVPA